MILIIDDVISEKQAQYCIDKFYQDIPSRLFHGKYIINNEQNFSDDSQFVEIMNSIVQAAHLWNPSIAVEWSELNYWPTWTGVGLHYDTSSDETVFTSVTYLNNSYRGGETFFEDGTVISPVIGRTVFFDGNKYKHGVMQLSHGSRFSLPVWYKKKDIVNDI